MKLSKDCHVGPGRLFYGVTMTDCNGADMNRAARILDAAVLQIEDKAPALFVGPAPLNTNQSDIGSYGSYGGTQ